jgi:hypothetical protein
MLLPDINVWLALTFDAHIHHPAAKPRQLHRILYMAFGESSCWRIEMWSVSRTIMIRPFAPAREPPFAPLRAGAGLRR